jgi:thiamine-phosphate pyrophosphorylase
VSRLRGLYAITDPGLTPPERLLDAVAAAIAGGAVVVQYRDKGADPGRRQAEASALTGLCHLHGVTFIVNDDAELAAEVGADGVHLGRDDGALQHARRLLGDRATIGVSCYDDLDRARRAAAEGADYVAFGSFFASSVKPDAVRATPGLLHAARRELALPVVAIGGITAENGAQLVTAGADMLAVISDVFGAADVQAAARRIARLF